MSNNCVCSVCLDPCINHCIQCGNCQKWYHIGCQNVSQTEHELLKDVAMTYTCQSCRNNTNGTFNFARGLERLRSDSLVSLEHLELCVQREKLFMKDETLNMSLHSDFIHQSQDPIANAIMSHYSNICVVRPPKISQIAVQSTDNGDCLFNSFSILLAGDESRAAELRYRCCIEMVTNRSKLLRHRLSKELEHIPPNLDDSCLECAKLGEGASTWNILALSNLLRVKVTVVYPAVNGPDDIIFKAMNQTFSPPFVDPDMPGVTIMWTSVRAPPKSMFTRKPRAKWILNHFVPLVNTNQPMQLAELPDEPDEDKDISNNSEEPIVIL